VLHAALFVGTVVATTILVWLRTNVETGVVALGAGPRMLARALVLTLAAGGTIGLRVLRAALPPWPGPDGPETWWQANLGRAIALWAFPDGVGTSAAVVYFLFGDTLVLALAAGWAIAMFVAYAPGRLTGG